VSEDGRYWLGGCETWLARAGVRDGLRTLAYVRYAPPGGIAAARSRSALARCVRRLEWSVSTPTILQMLSVAEAAEKIGRNPETVRRWIRSGRLPARRVGRHHEIEAGDLRQIEDELFPMAELPDEWKVGDDGTRAPNWVAALHRSRSGH
jgi:excisionase family DNA binding protein